MKRVRFLLYGASVKKCDGLENLLFRWQIQEKESIRLQCKNIGRIMSGTCSRAWKSEHRCIGRGDLEHFFLNARCKLSKLVELHYKFYKALFSPQDHALFSKPWPPVENIETLIRAQSQHKDSLSFCIIRRNSTHESWLWTMKCVSAVMGYHHVLWYAKWSGEENSRGTHEVQVVEMKDEK